MKRPVFFTALRALAVMCALLTGLCHCACASDKMKVFVTQPWLGLMASFLGGPNIDVAPLNVWNDAGTLVPADRGRMMRSLPADSMIVALDTAEASSLGLSASKYANISVLYDPFPIVSSIDSAMSDPSVLPFVAQRVLAVLSRWDPMNYAYYQRRLAEFQARLSSSILAGRKVLRGVSVLDLSGCNGALLQAVGCRLTRPDDERMNAIISGNTAYISEMMEADSGMIVVTDSASHKNILRLLSGKPYVFHMNRPTAAQDYPSFLHDQFISLWERTRRQSR